MTNKKRMDEAAKKIACVYVQYGHILHDHPEGLRPLDLLCEAIDLLSDYDKEIKVVENKKSKEFRWPKGHQVDGR